MALATICPHCSTTFRVASDQLKLRGGIVRCGACNEVFDGNAALIDLDAIPVDPVEVPEPAEETPLEEAPTEEPPVAETPVEEASVEEAPVEEAPVEEVPAEEAPVEEAPPEEAAEEAPEPLASAAFDAEVAAIEAKEAETAEELVYTLDFDTTFDPFNILPTQAEPAPEPEPEVDEEIVALPPPDDGHLEPELPDAPALMRDDASELPPSLLMRPSAAAEPAPPPLPELQVAASKSARRNAAKRKKAAQHEVTAPVPAAAEDAQAEPEIDEPEFVKRSRKQEQTGRTRRIAMAAASLLLLLALATQAMTTFRNVLAARYPDLKPLLVATCAVFGCRVELPAQIDTLTVETGELQSLGANAFSYTTLLRNPGSLAQAWPHIELALTDANDKPLVRRVFAPADYLPPGVAVAKGIGPRSEQPVKLQFELNQIKASGYHIAIFYP